MIKDNEIVIPEELKADMIILSTIKSPENEDIGILIMGENMEPNYYSGGLSVIRLYFLNKRNFKYHIEAELKAFAFHDLESAYDFLIRLPDMSALELLIMMKSPIVDVDVSVCVNMKCLICKVPFSPSDILTTEDDELPICYECDYEEHNILVEYDGNVDLLDHLKIQVHGKRICNYCLGGGLELHSIIFGDPIAAVVCCNKCKRDDTMNIYLRMT